MLPTPDTKHIDDLPVYPPSEDSFLLIDTLSAQREYLAARFTPAQAPFVVEVGTGSGVVIAFLTAHAQTVFGRKDVALLGLDLNPYACKSSRATVTQTVEEFRSTSAQYLGNCRGDLLSAIRHQSIDVLVFNPPYVPSEELPLAPFHIDDTGVKPAFDVESHLLDLAVSGGVDGMETTWLLLYQLDHVLSQFGVAYVLLCARNRPKEVEIKLQQSGWQTEKVGSSGKRGGIEKLCILRISRQT